MSNSSVKGAPSQNSEKKQEVTSWEIVKPTDYQHFQLHSKLIDTLSSTVTAKVDEIKKHARPESQLGSSGTTAASSSSSDPNSKSQTLTSVVIEDIAVSFECPEQFTAKNIDMDLAASCYRSSLERDSLVNPMKPLQFSFRERLQHWNLQSRMRPCGRIDMFYRYTRGRRSFRSVNEVVDFMLYEIFPDTCKQDMPQDQGNIVEGEDQAAAERLKKRRRSSIYRGGRRRKHKRTKGKAQQKAEEKSAIAHEEADDDDENTKTEQHTNPSSSSSEPQKQAPPNTDLADDEDAKNEEPTNPSSSVEPQKQTPPNTDLEYDEDAKNEENPSSPLEPQKQTPPNTDLAYDEDAKNEELANPSSSSLEPQKQTPPDIDLVDDEDEKPRNPSSPPEPQKQAPPDADLANDEDAKNEKLTNPCLPPEPQTLALLDTDLLYISEDLSAYESLFDKYFDGF